MTTRFNLAHILVWAALSISPFGAALAQGAAPDASSGATLPAADNSNANPSNTSPSNGAQSTTIQAAPAEPAQAMLSLSAVLGTDTRPLRSGLQWRVFQERAEASGSHSLVANSADATPSLTLPNGDYVVHVAFGLASAMKRVSIHGAPAAERLSLNAGALKISGVLGDAPIPANRLSIAIYVPERAGNEARLVVPDAKADELIRLPEGAYRIVSTYLDKDSSGSTPAPGAAANATNSIVNAEVRVQTGKVTNTTLRHHAALLTLKLVNNPGGEALANTSFSVLTPGGDIIREMIGAFPQLTLAEGEYVVIARRDGKTFQGSFKVQSTLDRDVEIIAK